MAIAVERKRNGNGGPLSAATRPLRCAIYTRKSTDEGLDSDFSSLDAQREACEAYVASQRAEGWVALDSRYDDGAQSGATLERPALRRLLLDVEARRVDCVVVHRVDRLSRSLLDFGRLIETFESHGAALVSVTQRLDTSTSMGRLTLNMLLSFAQFEREIIAERTRDKVRAARRRGKWTGGTIPLGYDLAPGGGRLVVNEIEAARVRDVFRVYGETGSLIATAEELNRRGWLTKQTAANGGTRGGVAWSKSSVHRVLSNPLYAGKIVVDGAAFKAESPAIVDRATWDAVQERLAQNAVAGSRGERFRSNALLAGILKCGHCGASMVPTHCLKRRGEARVRYSYYVCGTRLKRGRGACPSKHVSAPAIEAQVVAEIAKRAQEPAVVEAVTLAAREQLAEKRRALAAEKRAIQCAVREAEKERATTPAERLPTLDARVDAHEARRGAIDAELDALAGTDVDPDHVARTVADFPGLWAALLPRERRREVELIVERVIVHGESALTVTLSA